MNLALPLQPLRPWRTHPRETVAAALLGAIGLIALAQTSGATPLLPSFAKQAEQPAAPPQALPTDLRPLAPETALAVNAQIPVSAPSSAAAPFSLGKASAEDRARALECLTSAIYYEAGQESTDGQRAVAQVVLNRVRHPAFPSSVCGVVYEGSTRVTGCQFTFTCDGSLYRGADAAGWRRAYKVAEAAISGYVYAPVGNATHYHANYVVPYWAPTLAKNAVVGAHIFYRWAGGWGRPAAFAKAYAGREPSVAALRSAALAAEAATASQAQPGTVAEAVAEIPGAEALPLKPSMRGDKRVAVRFNLAAREATDKIEHEKYVEKVAASDNLRWVLSGEGAPAATEKPLGASAEPAAAGAPTVASAQH